MQRRQEEGAEGEVSYPSSSSFSLNCPFDCLPNEIVALVIEYVSESLEQLSQLKLVCQRWAEIVDTTKKIVIFEYDANVAGISHPYIECRLFNYIRGNFRHLSHHNTTQRNTLQERMLRNTHTTTQHNAILNLVCFSSSPNKKRNQKEREQPDTKEQQKQKRQQKQQRCCGKAEGNKKKEKERRRAMAS